MMSSAWASVLRLTRVASRLPWSLPNPGFRSTNRRIYKMLPDEFTVRVAEAWGQVGSDWLVRLPGIIAKYEGLWSLKVTSPYALSYNYVGPAVRADGTEVVLKLGVPGKEIASEVEALRAYDGAACVRVFEVDIDAGVMVIERLTPGKQLWTLSDDEEATSIAADVIRRLRTPAPLDREFQTVADWAASLGKHRNRLFGGTGPFPCHLFEKAERLFAELIGSMGDSVLLHGDLHHDNILSAQREPWLAIDPKGVVGEAEYEVGAYLRNRLPARPRKLMARRVDQLVEALGCDRERIVAWALAQAVLSAVWSLEDGGTDLWWRQMIACAEALDDLPDLP